MHSSSNNNISCSGILYPFPPYSFPFSSSSHNNHHPLLPQENTTPGGIFGLHQDQFSLVNNSFLPPGPESTMLNLGGDSSNAIVPSPGDYRQHYGYDINNISHPYFVSKDVQVPVVAVKKDRHSKIFTAQGFRDRRVRLSLNVAREFFDLQDLLGFDKASTTLEWLLGKSKNAIRDLEKSKCKNSFSSSSTSECDGVLEDNLDKRMRKMKEVAAIMARSSRENARARARERTREKMCRISKRSPQICSHLRLFNELQPADMNQEPGSTVLTEYQEYVALKRKLKAPSGSNYPDRSLELNPQRMEASSNCCSHINIQFPSAISPNWDINGGVFTCPSICAITANMNLNSSGIRVLKTYFASLLCPAPFLTKTIYALRTIYTI